MTLDKKLIIDKKRIDRETEGDARKKESRTKRESQKREIENRDGKMDTSRFKSSISPFLRVFSLFTKET